MSPIYATFLCPNSLIFSVKISAVTFSIGGSLVFDYGEAFTVVDVNTGRFTGTTKKLEDTILKNNLEAAVEVVRQRMGTYYDPQLAVPFKAAQGTGAQGDTSLWHIYDAIRCPVLAVRGERSDLLSRDTHEQMATRGPKAELVTIANVGHAPTFIHADQIAIAKDFLLRGL